jgi:hypothetical protein
MADAVPPDYWQAVIAALPPEKRDAAWRFYAEHGLDVAHEARDTLSGLLLLLEATGLFMERCARTLQESGAAPARLSELSTGLAKVADRLDRLDQNVRTQALRRPRRNADSPMARQIHIHWMESGLMKSMAILPSMTS